MVKYHIYKVVLTDLEKSNEFIAMFTSNSLPYITRYARELSFRARTTVEISVYDNREGHEKCPSIGGIILNKKGRLHNIRNFMQLNCECKLNKNSCANI